MYRYVSETKKVSSIPVFIAVKLLNEYFIGYSNMFHIHVTKVIQKH